MEYQLIELVKANPILYDRKYRNPRYREEKMEKWAEVALQLRRDPSTIRIRWKTLRDTYIRERQRKQREAEKDESERSHYTWKYYHHLEFLNSQLRESSNSNKIEQGEPEFAQYIQETTTYNDEEEEHDIEYEAENFDLNEYIKKIDNSTATVTNLSKIGTSEEMNKKRKIDKDAIINEACQEISSLLKNAKQRFTPPSPNQVFFNAMALQVEEAKLSPIDLMRLQQRLLEVVTQELVMYQDKTYTS
ncbi:transcription factor Adf-1-like [Musca vetustissima]|uniref:transcription factor Adf-1-like n=1 Tax=Musca vetustissima TaxID=27455 RepID=UPI002AB73832|nr:transcription factor Adf-1-like [Musca vetustissima]